MEKAWIVLIVGAVLFLAGIAGQFFGLGKNKSSSPDQRRARFLVLRIVCGVVGFWLVAVSVAKVAHLSATGHW
jgi:flagellar basal body-associated protein FliL